MKWKAQRILATALMAALLSTTVSSAFAQGRDADSRSGDQKMKTETAINGLGARVPFVEYPSESAATNGTVIGPDRAYGTLAAEAVGRQAVRLDATGQYVEFELEKAANAVNIRYSIPDSVDGAGLDATLGVYVDGRRIQSLSLTSRYSWYYGQFPWSNNPADGGQRQLFDDARVQFDSSLPRGTKVRLEVGAGDAAPWYVIDTADFEKVNDPIRQPGRSLSVVDYGAYPSGKTDSSDAIQRTIDAAAKAGRTVWVPQGTFTVTRHLIVDNVTVRGAGPWHSVLRGNGVGVYGNYAPNASSNVHLSDFAIFGEVKDRDDSAQLNAVGGSLNDSTVDNLWLQHTKVGVWVDGPFDNLRLSRLRILDQTADGINFHDGVTNSTVIDTYVRGTGDDGMAMWSEKHANANNTFTRNTVRVPALANNIAIYGGTDNKVTKNLVTDTVVQGGGIQIANRFNAVPLAGTTDVIGNVLLRTGSLDLFTHTGNGALWFWAGDTEMTGNVNVSKNEIVDSSYEAIQFFGKSITNVVLDKNNITNAGTFAVQLNAPGSATFRKTAASGLGASGVYDCGSGFTVVDDGGNEGWSNSACGYPTPGPLTLSADSLAFETDSIGVASDPQIVTVANTGSTPQRIASVTTTGAFDLTTTCGNEIAAGASCTVTMRFVPTPQGDRSGSLTISDGSPAGRYQTHVRGQVIANTVGNLAAGRPAVASSEAGCCLGSYVTDSNTDTYWESDSNAFPQTLTVDLGDTAKVSRVSFKINAGWGGQRTERFEILASDDGATFTSVVEATDYTFDSAANNNTIEITLPQTIEQRYVRVEVTANSGWPAAQIAEFEIYE